MNFCPNLEESGQSHHLFAGKVVPKIALMISRLPISLIWFTLLAHLKSVKGNNWVRERLNIVGKCSKFAKNCLALCQINSSLLLAINIELSVNWLNLFSNTRMIDFSLLNSLEKAEFLCFEWKFCGLELICWERLSRNLIWKKRGKVYPSAVEGGRVRESISVLSVPVTSLCVGVWCFVCSI